MTFIYYIADLATSTDEKARIAAKALYEDEEPEKYKEALDRVESKGATAALRNSHRSMVLEMMICRGADNFLTYLSDLLALIFGSRPETLMSSETVRLDEVLKHNSMDELIQELVDRKVNQLSYQGMKDLHRYVADKMGLDLYPDDQDLNRAIRLIESRNLIVHNRGLVNEHFLSRVPDSSAKLDGPLPLSTDEIFEDLEFLLSSVQSIDARAIQKFNLPTTTG